jgi:DNA polymerase-4
MQRAICHINIVGFRAAVASAKDRTLKGCPFVIAGDSGGRALILDMSPEVLKEGLEPGMALAVAERRVKGLAVLAPDPPACAAMNEALEKIVAVYAPAYEHDGGGNFYLDMTGTTALFGPPADCSSKILREVLEQTGLYPAAAVATNKLVSKIATRMIRPAGLIHIQAGMEAAFLVHQDIRLLPGMGPKLVQIATATGMREIGDIAALSNGEVVSLFGKFGPVLRDKALGLDDSPVRQITDTALVVDKKLQFAESTIEWEVIRAGIVVLAETAGLEMRGAKLGAQFLQLAVTYADGVQPTGEATDRLFITDREIADGAVGVYRKIVPRRLRVRALGLRLADLRPLSFQPDLFLPEPEEKSRHLQDAADAIRTRYGHSSLMTAAVLAASSAGAAGVALALPAHA